MHLAGEHTVSSVCHRDMLHALQSRESRQRVHGHALGQALVLVLLGGGDNDGSCAAAKLSGELQRACDGPWYSCARTLLLWQLTRCAVVEHRLLGQLFAAAHAGLAMLACMLPPTPNVF